MHRDMQILEAADKSDGKYISSLLSTGNDDGGFQCMGRTEAETKWPPFFRRHIQMNFFTFFSIPISLKYVSRRPMKDYYYHFIPPNKVFLWDQQHTT